MKQKLQLGLRILLSPLLLVVSLVIGVVMQTCFFVGSIFILPCKLAGYETDLSYSEILKLMFFLTPLYCYGVLEDWIKDAEINLM